MDGRVCYDTVRWCNDEARPVMGSMAGGLSRSGREDRKMSREESQVEEAEEVQHQHQERRAKGRGRGQRAWLSPSPRSLRLGSSSMNPRFRDRGSSSHRPRPIRVLGRLRSTANPTHRMLLPPLLLSVLPVLTTFFFTQRSRRALFEHQRSQAHAIPPPNPAVRFN